MGTLLLWCGSWDGGGGSKSCIFPVPKGRGSGDAMLDSATQALFPDALVWSEPVVREPPSAVGTGSHHKARLPQQMSPQRAGGDCGSHSPEWADGCEDGCALEIERKTRHFLLFSLFPVWPPLPSIYVRLSKQSTAGLLTLLGKGNQLPRSPVAVDASGTPTHLPKLTPSLLLSFREILKTFEKL